MKGLPHAWPEFNFQTANRNLVALFCFPPLYNTKYKIDITDHK